MRGKIDIIATLSGDKPGTTKVVAPFSFVIEGMTRDIFEEFQALINNFSYKHEGEMVESPITKGYMGDMESSKEVFNDEGTDFRQN